MALLFSFVFYGCHNNSHLRTQRVLKEGEKAISLNGNFNVWGVARFGDQTDNELVTSNVLGLRAEVSSLRGVGKSELGPYLGFGTHNGDEYGFVLGYDYRKYFYLKSLKATKIGGQIELNISNIGTTLHLRPSWTSTTNKNIKNYYGLHGIFALGDLKQYVETYSDDWDMRPVPYNFLSIGAGFTVGKELILFKDYSLQLQYDFSIVSNTYSSNDNFYRSNGTINNEGYYSYIDYKPVDFNNGFFPLLSMSAGTGFLKPKTLENRSLEPLPKPDPTEPIYDPSTGKLIKEKKQSFDPNTGEPLKEKTNTENQKNDEQMYMFLNSNERGQEFITKKEVIKLATQNAQKEHIGILWNIFGLSGVPTGLFTGLMAAEVLDDINMGFPGFISGGILGISLPTLIAGGSSPISEINYPHDIITNEQKEGYKTTYQSEIKILRKKSTALGTGFGVISFGGFILLLINGF